MMSKLRTNEVYLFIIDNGYTKSNATTIVYGLAQIFNTLDIKLEDVADFDDEVVDAFSKLRNRGKRMTEILKEIIRLTKERVA